MNANENAAPDYCGAAFFALSYYCFTVDYRSRILMTGSVFNQQARCDIALTLFVFFARHRQHLNVWLLPKLSLPIAPQPPFPITMLCTFAVPEL